MWDLWSRPLRENCPTAVSRNTYVWVGFATVTNTSGNLETCVGVMISNDGTSVGTSFEFKKANVISGKVTFPNNATILISTQGETSPARDSKASCRRS